MRLWCSLCGKVAEFENLGTSPRTGKVYWPVCYHGGAGSLYAPREMDPMPRWHPLAPSLFPTLLGGEPRRFWRGYDDEYDRRERERLPKVRWVGDADLMPPM